MPNITLPPATIITEETPIYGFTSLELIRQIYSVKGYSNLLADLGGNSADEANVVDQAIRDAEETMMVRLGQYFEPGHCVGNRFITSRATWIAAYYVASRRGNEHYFQEKYEEAMRELDAIAQGQLPPPPEIPLRAQLMPAMTNFTIDENFGVQKNRVRPTISVGGTYPNQHIAYGYVYGWF